VIFETAQAPFKVQVTSGEAASRLSSELINSAAYRAANQFKPPISKLHNEPANHLNTTFRFVLTGISK